MSKLSGDAYIRDIFTGNKFYTGTCFVCGAREVPYACMSTYSGEYPAHFHVCFACIQPELLVLYALESK